MQQTLNKIRSKKDKFRNGILTLYILILPLSILFAVTSALVVDISANDAIFSILSACLIFSPFVFLFTILMVKYSKAKNMLWLLLPLVPISIFFITSAVSDHIINNRNTTSLPQPLSQRGLPPPETDVTVTLPPDPGEAGKQTLAGIDSNNDGVRDDLEREIVYMYPQNEEVRRVLRAMVKKGQEMITTTGDHEHFKNIMESYSALRNCYEFLEFPVGKFDPTNGTVLYNLIQNTKERRRLFNNNEKRAYFYATPIYSSTEACSQPLAKDQY